MGNVVEDVTGRIDLDKKIGGGLRPPKGARKYAILRVKKLAAGSGKSSVAAAAGHNLRERETLNARSEDLGKNIHLAGGRTTDEVMKIWDDLAPDKVRKNAVPAIEYVMTASPEEAAQMGPEKTERYLRDAFEWVSEKHGAQNVLNATIHMDETTPHLQVLIMPIDERGKMNARGLIGSKGDLSKMQSDYAERVGAKHGLERGVQGSRASHQTIKEYYARANANENISLTLPGRAVGGVLGRGGETDAEYRSRLSEIASEAVRAIAGRISSERDSIYQELTELKLHQADADTKNQTLTRNMKVLEVARNVATYTGDDKKSVQENFHSQYINRAADLPDEICFAIDSILHAQGRKGYEDLRIEREAHDLEVARQEEQREIAVREAQREQEERERQIAQAESERDTGYER